MIGINKIQKAGLVRLVLIFILFSSSGVINAQIDKKYIRKGNKEYENADFSESEVSYRKAIDKNRQSPDAIFNIGDALYKQEKFEDAGKQFVENINLHEDKERKSSGLYNLGNSLLMEDKVKESIEAYKESLKLNPGNNQAKYNLAYAQDLLKQQEQQKQDKDNKDQDQDKNKEDQTNDQNNEENQQQKDQNNEQEQQQQQQNISKEDAERLLNALANDEKEVQEKVKLAKAAKDKVRTVKNW